MNKSNLNTFDLVMISTFIHDEYISFLLNSIEANNDKISIKLILVKQGDFPYRIPKLDGSLLYIEMIETGLIGLSAARNIALDYIIACGYSSRLVMFPDDDTTFDEVFFNNFCQVTLSHSNYLMPIKDSPTSFYKRFDIPDGKLLKKSDFIYVGSPNMLIDFQLFKENIRFDENLGVGSRYGSCEDVDFFLKTNSILEFKFTSELYNFHPRKVDRYNAMAFKEILKRFKGYSSGYIYTMLKYNFKIYLLSMLFRTVAASFIFFLRLKFRLSFAYFLQFFIRIHLMIVISRSNNFNQGSSLLGTVELKSK